MGFGATDFPVRMLFFSQVYSVSDLHDTSVMRQRAIILDRLLSFHARRKLLFGAVILFLHSSEFTSHEGVPCKN